MKEHGTKTPPSPEQEMDTISAAIRRTRGDQAPEAPAGWMNGLNKAIHAHNDRLARILTRIEGVVGAFDGVPEISYFVFEDAYDSGASGCGYKEALWEQLCKLDARLDALDRAAEKLEEL